MPAAATKTRENQQKSGTWAVIRYAKLRNVTVVVLRIENLKTKHSYHYADIVSVSLEDEAGVVFEVRLCGCSDSPAAIVHIAFHRVRNIDPVRNFIDQLKATSTRREGCLAEIVGFSRDDARRFILQLNNGPLYLDAGGFTET